MTQRITVTVETDGEPSQVITYPNVERYHVEVEPLDVILDEDGPFVRATIPGPRSQGVDVTVKIRARPHTGRGDVYTVMTRQ